jgi:hypothetical protein
LTTDLEQYAARYLQQWEERATVRSRPRTRLTAETAALPMFPAMMMPVLKHEALSHWSDAQRHEYSVRMACDFQLAVALLELDPVTDLCGKLAGHGMGVVLPEAARQVALTIATDEAYHALAAREFTADVERLTGIALPAEERSTDVIVKALTYVRQAAPAELLRPAETMVLCFAENFITGELFGLSKDGASDSPFQVTMREHLVDEGRHQLFFQNLMRHLWSAIDEEARVALGRLVPGFLDTFLLDPDSFIDLQARILSPMGFDHETSKRMIVEAFTAAFGPPPAEKHQRVFARNSLKLVEIAGLPDHAPTREALVASGWIAA